MLTISFWCLYVFGDIDTTVQGTVANLCRWVAEIKMKVSLEDGQEQSHE